MSRASPRSALRETAPRASFNAPRACCKCKRILRAIAGLVFQSIMMTAPSPGGRERSDSVASSVFEQHDESFVRSTRRTLDNFRVSVVDVGILVVLLGLCLLPSQFARSAHR